MRKLLALISTQISQITTYRIEFFSSAVMVFLRYSILVSLWRITAIGNPDAERRLLLYFALNLVILSSYTSKLAGNFSKMIVSGEINNYLLRPISPAVVSFANSITKIAIRFLSPAAIFLLAVFIWPETFAPASFMSLLVFFIFFTLGLATWNLLMLLIGITAFWTSTNAGLRTVIDLVLNFFLGAFMPVYLFPATVQSILSYTPLKYMAAFPIEVYRGAASNRDMVLGLVILLVWIGLLWVASRWLYKLGLQKYDANGA